MKTSQQVNCLWPLPKGAELMPVLLSPYVVTTLNVIWIWPGEVLQACAAVRVSLN